MTILICWTKFSQKECFRSKTEKVNTTNEFFIFELFLVISFSLNMTFFYFFNQICSNSEHHRWILDFRNSLDTKFQLKLTILIFWTKFAKKGYFQSKAEKLNITIEFCIFELVQEPNFSASTDIFYFLDQVCPKRVFSVKNGKSKHHHWILDFRSRDENSA